MNRHQMVGVLLPVLMLDHREGVTMPKMRLMRSIPIALAVVISITAIASADPKRGCPVGTGWNEMTVEDVAQRTWPALLDPSPWVDEADFRESFVRPIDRNGDGSICLKIMWGEKLNPNSHWYMVGIELIGSPTEQFLGHDNNANASNN